MKDSDQHEIQQLIWESQTRAIEELAKWCEALYKKYDYRKASKVFRVAQKMQRLSIIDSNRRS